MTHNDTTPEQIPAHNNATAAGPDALAHAVKMIPPVWPLATSVAVNPFLGQSGQSLAQTGALLERVGGVRVTMPRSWYAARVAANEITLEDLTTVLAANTDPLKPIDTTALLTDMGVDVPAPAPLPTIADLAAQASGIDWPAIIAERIGHWASGHFDGGQALWAAGHRGDAWGSWQGFARVDLTPELAGLRGFRAHVGGLDGGPEAAFAQSVEALGLTAPAAPTYLHGLAFGLGGWAQYARHLLWKAELAGGTDSALSDLITLRLVWEAALLNQYRAQISDDWARVHGIHATPVEPDANMCLDAILQDAADRGAARALAATLAAGAAGAAAPSPRTGRPDLQAAFCIDVRSEVFRRALEAQAPGISTHGFAGFFGLTAQHRGPASDLAEDRLPVLLSPGVTSTPAGAGSAQTDALRHSKRASRAWGRFKQAAVSGFAYVEAAGPLNAANLLRGALALDTPTPAPEPKPELDPAMDLDTRVTTALTILRAMSLTTGFARLVLLVGHGTHVTNNPHASGLQCGACGGYSGEVNARLLAGLLNAADVRAGLAEAGLEIPADTLFVAGLHDTTTDMVTLFAEDAPAQSHASDLTRARSWLSAAGKQARAERALFLPLADSGDDIARRARDWAEVRPEWALAGCKAFVAAPRARTQACDLGGRAFLHDYDWQADEANGFGVLELILTAPVVVASWISLQYYGSTVAPEAFGSGNKLLHNVVGGIGVVEGNGGPLRAGLALQSVHDGTDFIHQPLRLNVVVAAPPQAILDILARHDGVRDLFDNGWLTLMCMGEDGQITQRYVPGLSWESVAATDRIEAA